MVADIRWEFARLWESRRTGNLDGDITRRLFPGTDR
jgi:hypothetical protein